MKAVPSSSHKRNAERISHSPAITGEGQDLASETSVSFIDVGKGDCILVQSGQSAALIDTGYDETSQRVVSYLRKRGVAHIDRVIISHYDKDHIGGMEALGKAFPIGTVHLPGYEGSDKNYRALMSAIKNLGVPATQTTEPFRTNLGSAVLAIHPSTVRYVPNAHGDEGNDNDLSLVATLTSESDSFLFTGDLEEDGIEAFLRENLGHFGVLKMPHHGQKSSCTDELLDDIRPQVAVITDSAEDPADKKTLKLLVERNVDAYRSSTSGTVIVSGDGKGNYSVTLDEG